MELEKLKIGRPLKYDDLDIELEAEALLEWTEKHKEDEVFWLKNFALERGYAPQRLSDFANKNKYFMETLNYVKGIQEFRIVNGGLLNDYNSKIVGLLLKNCHYYQDKVEQVVIERKSQDLPEMSPEDAKIVHEILKKYAKDR